MTALGIHVLLELYGCGYKELNNVDGIKDTLLRATRLAGATIVDSSFRKFQPYGVSGVVIIAESHITIHTWPEHGYAAVDVFTCGNEVMPQRAVEEIVSAFKPKQFTSRTLKRGKITSATAKQHGQLALLLSA